MKVVLFCGGQGMRLRGHSDTVPKPMVKIGDRPIMWHLMKYYAHFGHTEFVLCLGWQADVIRDYFQKNNDLPDWKITFVETGTESSIGERLLAMREHVADDEYFLANYADGLTDMHLPDLTEFGQQQNTVGSFLAVRPSQSFHQVLVDPDGRVDSFRAIQDADVWMNGGYFLFRREIFDYLLPGEDLVEEPFDRLLEAGQLSAMKYDGFWACMDTYKEMQKFEERFVQDDMPWQVWRDGPAAVDRPLPIVDERSGFVEAWNRNGQPNGNIKQ